MFYLGNKLLSVYNNKNKIKYKMNKKNNIPIILDKAEITTLFNSNDEISIKAYNIPNNNSEKINYFSTNNFIANIDNNGNIFINSIGECEIYAENESGNRAYCKVNVLKEVKTESINIITNNLIFKYDKPSQIQYEIIPQNSTDKVTFETNNKNVARVNDNGLVFPISNGSCEIIIKSNNIERKINVLVEFVKTEDIQSRILSINNLTHRFSGRQEKDLYSTNRSLNDLISKKEYTEVLNGVGFLGKDGWIGKGIRLNKGNYVKNVNDEYCYGYFDFVDQLSDIDLYNDYTININFRQLEKTRDQAYGCDKYLIWMSYGTNNYCSMRVYDNKIYFCFGGQDNTQYKSYSTEINGYNYFDEEKDNYFTISVKKRSELNSEGNRVYDAIINCNGYITKLEGMINPDNYHETCPVDNFRISNSKLLGGTAYYNLEMTLYDLNIFNRPLTENEISELHELEYNFTESYVETTDIIMDPNTDLINIKNGDKLKLSTSIIPNNSDSKYIEFSTSDGKIAFVDENNILYGIGTGRCNLVCKIVRENIIKNIEVIVSNGYEITPYIKEINMDETITTTLFEQNYQPLYGPNIARPTTMYTFEKLANNNQYAIFITDTLPYCFDFPLSNKNYTDHIVCKDFTSVTTSNFDSFEGRAICAYSNYNLNYMKIKVPVSDLKSTSSNDFGEFIRLNKFPITFKLLNNDEYTFKTTIDGNKDIKIIYDNKTDIDNYLQFKIRVNGLISEYDIKAGRNLFLSNFEYNDFSSMLPRNEWYCWYEDSELYIKVKINKNLLSSNDITGIREYLNNNNLVIYSNIHDKTINITSFKLNQTKYKTNLSNTIKLIPIIEPENASHKREIDWVSSDNSVAEVVDGIVYPRKAGECIITAYSRNSKMFDSCSFVIFDSSKIKTVETMKNDLTLKVGDVYETNGYYFDNDGGAAIYDIMEYDTWLQTLPDDLKLVSYKERVFEKNPVDGYGNHLLKNGLVAKLRIIDGITYAAQWGVSELLKNNAKEIQAALIYNRYNTTLKFKEGANYLISHDKFNRRGYEHNEYSALTACLQTKYLNIGNCRNMIVDFNNSTIKINDAEFDALAYISISGNIDGLEIKNMIFDGNCFNIRKTNMTVPTYHAIVIRSGRMSLQGNYQQMAEEVGGLNIDDTIDCASFRNIKIRNNTFSNLGTAVSLAQSTGADNGGDAILIMILNKLDNIYIENNTVINWGRWFVAIDLPAPNNVYTNVNINNNRCIQDENNSFVHTNGDRRFRGMGWVDFETTATFNDLHVEGNYVNGLTYFAFNGGGHICENINIKNNVINRTTNRSYLRGALDLPWSFYSFLTKDLLFEGNEFINTSPNALGLNFRGTNIFRNNKGGNVTLYSLDGDIIFENNDNFGIIVANNKSNNICGLDQFGNAYNWGWPVELMERHIIFRNNKRLQFSDGIGANITIFDKDKNNKYNNLHILFENNIISNVKLSNIDNIDVQLDLDKNTFINESANLLRMLPRSNSYRTAYLGLYTKKDQIIAEGTIINNTFGNTAVPTNYYYYGNNIGIDPIEWETKYSRSFNKLYVNGYTKVICVKEGYLPVGNLDATNSFQYFKGKSVSSPQLLVCNETRRLYIVIYGGVLSNTEPTDTSGNDFKNGTATLRYICDCAIIQMVKE